MYIPRGGSESSSSSTTCTEIFVVDIDETVLSIGVNRVMSANNSSSRQLALTT